jgi:hypothetical protein
MKREQSRILAVSVARVIWRDSLAKIADTKIIGLTLTFLKFLLRDFTYVYDQVRITITAETGVTQTEVDCELTNGALSSRY